MTPKIDTSKPHAARVYDYLLGGKDHFAADRKTAQRIMAAVPTAPTAARENRAFMGRAVRFLVTEAKIRQFLDIGAGLPSANNVHEVAQEMAPECRVLYADNDPIVLAHARALLTSAPQGRTAYIQADLREPEAILANPVTRGTLDFSQPAALVLAGILHFIMDDEDPAGIVRTLLGALAPGSYLVASHATTEYDPGRATEGARIFDQGGVPFRVRTSDEFESLAFTGLELVDPGLVVVSEWRPDREPRPSPAEVSINGGVARKP